MKDILIRSNRDTDRASRGVEALEDKRSWFVGVGLEAEAEICRLRKSSSKGSGACLWVGAKFKGGLHDHPITADSDIRRYQRQIRQVATELLAETLLSRIKKLTQRRKTFRGIKRRFTRKLLYRKWLTLASVICSITEG